MPRFAVAALALALGCGRGEPVVDAGPPPTSPDASASEAAPDAGEDVGAPPVVPRAVACGESHDTPGDTLLLSPLAPHPGETLRAIAASERETDATLVVLDGDRPVAWSSTRHGGPPAWWSVETKAPAGAARAVLVRGDAVVACRDLAPAAEDAPSRARWGVAWPVERAWTRATEDLYAAWIEHLFDAPLSEQPSWPALHDVLRDPARNLLFDHRGLGEDDGTLVLDPDCADLPFFLRGYFAWKLRLPFGYSACSRGDGGQAPRCFRWQNNLFPQPRTRHGPAAAFGDFLRVKVADTVHSGSGRALATEDNTDFYPVKLTADAIRPGAIYADPYGHVLVVAKRIAQTPDAAGVLLAVDGQPDGTVGRKRFWRGNFLFALDPALGSPGFKRFRPVIEDGKKLRQLTNAEIAARADYGDFSLEQLEGTVDGFYDRMDEVLSPAPLDPTRALLETITALEEQVRTRVTSVGNGEKYFADGGATVEMPDEPAAIFETTGPWEDFSTPSRDLRLLIAIDVATAFPARVAAKAGRYAMPAGQTPDAVRDALERTLRDELAKRSVTYTRSDGSPWTLSLADVVARAPTFETAYDPNDCVEIRWGAPAKSDESSPCRRRAPGGDRAKMAKFRRWFHDRRRPPRP